MNVEEHPFYKSLHPKMSLEFLKSIQCETYAAGAIIFEEQSSADYLFLILEGSVDFIRAQQIVSTAQAGDFFGEISVLTNEMRSLTAKAHQLTQLALVPKKELLMLLDSTDGPLETILKNIIHHLKNTTSKYITDITEKDKMAIIGNMMNTLVHDFKNPFTVIRWSAQTLAQKFTDSDSQQLCKTIELQIEHMFQMVNEINEFSRGNKSLKIETNNLRQIFDLFKELNAPLFANEHIRIEYSIEDVSFECEQMKLIRCLQNLIVNAMDALETVPNALILVTGKDMGDTVELIVKDNGPGIPEAIRATFLTPFVTYGKIKGTGLGASIVKSIAEAHHGTLTYTTGAEIGTTFTIKLPKKQPALEIPSK